MLCVKALAAQARISAVASDGRQVVLRFRGLLPPAVIQQARRFDGQVTIGRNRLSLDRQGRWRELLVALLMALAEMPQSEPAPA
jgi:hypothetical protein